MTSYNNMHSSASCFIHDSINTIENISHQIIDVASQKSIPVINDFFNIKLDKNVYTYPNYQLKRNEDQMLAYLEIPGVKKENCQIIFKRGELIFKGKSNHNEDFSFVKPKDYLRHIKIPICVEKSHVDATYENGVIYLTINIPNNIQSDIPVSDNN